MIVPPFTQSGFSNTDTDPNTTKYRTIAQPSFSVLATECVTLGYTLRFCGPYGNSNREQFQVDYEKPFKDKFILFNMKWSLLFPDEYLISLVLIAKYSSTILMEHRIAKDDVLPHALAYADYVRELEAFLNRVNHFGNCTDNIHESYYRRVKLRDIL